MIAKKFRLSREKISFILKKGIFSKTKLFLIRKVKNNLNFNRYALVVSKKIYKKAVNRNKLRRRIYNSIRHNMNLEKNKNFDIVLIPKKLIIHSNFQNINEDITNILKTL